MPKADPKDLLILRILDADGRASASKIAKLTRLSKSAVSQRISALESEGYIQGYYALIDSSRLGLQSFRVYLKYHNTSPRMERQIMEFLSQEPRVWWCGKMQGDWDAGLVVWARDVSEFRSFWLSFSLRFRQHIGRYVVNPYVKIRHYSLAFLCKAEGVVRQVGTVGEGPKAAIDSTDRKILSVISEDGRCPLILIAKKTGLSPGVVKYRLVNLVRAGVIQGYRAMINSEKLGYSLYKVNFVLNDVTKLAAIREFTEFIPNLAYIDETAGEDLEADYYLSSELELEKLLDSYKARFHSAIREINYLVYSHVSKQAYYPQKI